jgi:multisubunit Na+/H+ antiporter MnhG subunit
VRVTALAAMGGGLLVVLGAFWLMQRNDAFLRAAATTEGRIVGVVERQGDDSVLYAAVVEFTDRDGRPHRFESRSSYGDREHWRIGAPVNVRYDPSRPERSGMDQDHYGVIVTILGIAGAGFFLFGVALWFLARLIRRPTASAETASRTG